MEKNRENLDLFGENLDKFDLEKDFDKIFI